MKKKYFDVFISYNWKDEIIVDYIVDFFDKNNISYFRDKTELKLFDKLSSTLKSNISNSRFLISIITTNYLISYWCMFEALEAISAEDLEVKFLPIIVNYKDNIVSFDNEFILKTVKKINIEKELLEKKMIESKIYALHPQLDKYSFIANQLAKVINKVNDRIYPKIIFENKTATDEELIKVVSFIVSKKKVVTKFLNYNEEIEFFLETNDYNKAISKLLDFTDDLVEYKVKETIKLRKEYIEIVEKFNKVGKKINDINKFDFFEKKILNLKNSISDDFYNKTDKKGNFDYFNLRKDEYLSNKFYKSQIIFHGRKLSKSYKNKLYKFRLEEIDIKLNKGEITALVGKNGNGKSTLLKIIAGEITPDTGEFSFPILFKDEFNWYKVKHHIAYVSQTIPKRYGTLEENLHFAASIRGINGDENIERVDFIISRLGLELYRKSKWNEVSGGYQMRFELARVLVWRPKLIILDEPLANLDKATQFLFLNDLREIANYINRPLSIIISSQHLREVEDICDNLIFLEDGKSIYNGKMIDFGTNRTNNTFEVSSIQRIDIILHKQTEIKINKIIRRGKNYIIETMLDVRKKDLIDFFEKNEINYNQISDISKSTSKYFV